MPLLPLLRHVGNAVVKSRGRGTKPDLSRTQRRARDLMSFASVFAFGAVAWWLFVALLLWQSSGSSDPAEAQRMLAHWHLLPKASFNIAVLASAWVLAFGATMAPIICLRRLGKALYTQPPLSFVVARRFSWLGHALVANIIGGFVAGGVAASQIPQYQLTFSLGFLGTAVAAILAYVVADVIHEGACASEENREFI